MRELGMNNIRIELQTGDALTSGPLLVLWLGEESRSLTSQQALELSHQLRVYAQALHAAEATKTGRR